MSDMIHGVVSRHGFPEQWRDTFPTVLYFALPPHTRPISVAIIIIIVTLSTLPLLEAQLITRLRSELLRGYDTGFAEGPDKEFPLKLALCRG
jgi:hypothetical protein